jgi:hypothetical protein
MTTPPVSTTDTIDLSATRVERLQDGTLLLIVLLVGLMAGAASFNHVHDWTLANSPHGTADWFGWANAVISELIPTASLIEIGRRRRRNPHHAKIGYPMVLLVAAVSVSLTAQLAVAQPSVFGWMVSALPALAFFALSKLVFTATAAPRSTNPVTAEQPATSPATATAITQAEVRPPRHPTPRAQRPARPPHPRPGPPTPPRKLLRRRRHPHGHRPRRPPPRQPRTPPHPNPSRSPRRPRPRSLSRRSLTCCWPTLGLSPCRTVPNTVRTSTPTRWPYDSKSRP